MEAKSAKTQNSGTVHVCQEDSEISLYSHQVEAFSAMTKLISEQGLYPYKGMLILPTGGGKTLTAARWIGENVIDKGVKVLWVAHRHELLEQAQRTFCQILAYKDVFKTRKSFKFRIISGMHDRPINSQVDDDIIFAGKDSICRESALNILKSRWLDGTDELFVVIDEAHHAAAVTYRNLIKGLEEAVPKFRMLGLTATPFRTEERKEGSLLQKIFPDNIIYKVDLTTLIRQGILSEPRFEEVDTQVDMTQLLSDKQIDLVNKGFFDFSSIGEDVAGIIANNRSRNRLIVNKYLENKDRYGKTIVFAVNAANTIALNKLFKDSGVRSDFVLSTVRDSSGLYNISSKDNKDKIARFRKGGDIDVLINVDILTEGTDVPDVQTVFLTRPTSSKILMTQMMGRGLRGERAGGTKEAYIVSFIDQWSDKIAWVSPEKLYIDDINFTVPDPETRKYLLRLISIKKIEEFAVLSDRTIDPERKALLESVSFLKRLPLGFYKFEISVPQQDAVEESASKSCEVLVYEETEKGYRAMFDYIRQNYAQRFEQHSTEREEVSAREIDRYTATLVTLFFPDHENYLAFKEDDVASILMYYFQHGDLPKFYQFMDREKYNVENLANYIIDNDLGPRKEQEYLTAHWNNEQDGWQAFFNFDFCIFKKEIDNAKNRIYYPEQFHVSHQAPQVELEDRSYEDMSLKEIAEVDPDYAESLRDEVYNKYTDENGMYYSALSGITSNNRHAFEIDHIVPLSQGGKTVLENLQLLTVGENRRKGASVMPDAEAVDYEDADDEQSPRTVTRLKVTCPDGMVIDCPKAVDTFCQAIIKAGPMRVYSLDLQINKLPLVGSVPSDKYTQKKIEGGWYVTTHCSTAQKKGFLDKISSSLGLGWNVEIV